MKRAVKSKKDRAEERRLRELIEVFAKRDIIVRREKLARGHSFRVKSGNCLYVGQDHIFVDRRLPPSQQVSMLLDFILELKLELDEEELELLTKNERELVLQAKAA